MKSPFFGNWVLVLSAFSLAVAACTPEEARYYCMHGDPSHPLEGGFTGPGLEGCVVGASEIGGKFTRIQDADAECQVRFNVQAIPYRDDPEWFSETSEMIDRRNGCHFGAKGRLKVDTGITMDSGCVERMDTASGHVLCLPEGGLR